MALEHDDVVRSWVLAWEVERVPFSAPPSDPPDPPDEPQRSARPAGATRDDDAADRQPDVA